MLETVTGIQRIVLCCCYFDLNTYRTLMTRGMKGCIVYCTDHEMAEYMRRRLAAYSEGFSKTREKKT